MRYVVCITLSISVIFGYLITLTSSHKLYTFRYFRSVSYEVPNFLMTTPDLLRIDFLPSYIFPSFPFRIWPYSASNLLMDI